MNWAQFKDPASHLCLPGTLVALYTKMAGSNKIFLLLTSVKTFRNKNTFQWDVYHPFQWPLLVVWGGGCMPLHTHPSHALHIHDLHTFPSPSLHRLPSTTSPFHHTPIFQHTPCLSACWDTHILPKCMMGYTPLWTEWQTGVITLPYLPELRLGTVKTPLIGPRSC